MIEKSVELGAREIWPLQSEHSEGFFHRERLYRVAVAARKQSQRTWLPKFGKPIGWAELADIGALYDSVLLCHEQQSVETAVIIAFAGVQCKMQ
ncbi:MAG: RNA methyltransferase [Chlorobi bacterium]|nr:RNA methyltransferase [Chlorobiota bacterium]